MTTGLEQYFSELIPERDEPLLELEREAEAEDLPIVGPLVGWLLYVLAGAVNPGRILELGTCTGYSAVFLARGAPNAQLDTVEQDFELAGRAENNFKRAGLAQRVRVINATAAEALAELDATYDLAFIDIEKDQYQPALGDLGRLVRPGGLLIADNTAFSDARPFNQAILDDPRWLPVPLLAFLPRHSPAKDGLTLALRMDTSDRD
jgi:predicted O-methyltransferase YrrM